ncbi:hypothetical protein Q7P37_010945 [Cladosporium fusiforme]
MATTTTTTTTTFNATLLPHVTYYILHNNNYGRRARANTSALALPSTRFVPDHAPPERAYLDASDLALPMHGGRDAGMSKKALGRLRRKLGGANPLTMATNPVPFGKEEEVEVEDVSVVVELGSRVGGRRERDSGYVSGKASPPAAAGAAGAAISAPGLMEDASEGIRTKSLSAAAAVLVPVSRPAPPPLPAGDRATTSPRPLTATSTSREIVAALLPPRAVHAARRPRAASVGSGRQQQQAGMRNVRRPRAESVERGIQQRIDRFVAERQRAYALMSLPCELAHRSADMWLIEDCAEWRERARV